MDSLLSDFDSFSESSSSEDQEDLDSLYGGQARNIFSSLEETIEKIDDFLMFERGFLQGDIVCLVSDPLGKMGKVVNVDITVDLENINGRKIHNVNSTNLQKLHSVSVGDYVVHGAWLGKIEKIVDRLTILFDDGTKCQLSADGPEKIIALSPDSIEDPQYPFYPGQRVQIESSVSTSTRWLCGNRNNKQEQGTVCNVDAGLVYVEWLNCAVTNGEKGPTLPCLQDSKYLSVLSCFPQANWQLGDWCVLPVESRDLTRNFPQIAVIVKTKTKVDVQWQDGSKSLGLDSHLLFPVNIVDAHDFWPDAYVLEKGTVDDSQGSGIQRWGIVRSVDPKERTVKVKWYSENEQIEEIVSAYELVEHPDYSFCLGEAVFRMDKGIIDLTGGNFETDLKVVENSGQTEYLNNKQFLSYFGTVVGFKNGDVEVKWGTGATSKVAPCEIFRVDKCDGTTASVLDNESVQPPNEEMKDQFLGQKLKDVFGLNYDNAKDSSSHSISQVAIGIFTSITSSLFGSLISGYKCTSEGGQIDGKPPSEEALELCNLNHGGQLLVVEDLEMHEKNVTSLQIKEVNEDILLPSSSKHPECFRQFDMVNDCSDHHFVNENGMDLQSPQVKRGWLKKVHQEWSILEKDLPETIYIRAYEEKMGLLRAAIVGTAGTPYHDGLFFFDIYLPPKYPNEPPHFEALVDEHFSRRSRNILLACKAYMQGAPIGYPFDYDKAEQEIPKGSSTGFKIMLTKLYSRLVEAFSDKGFDCSDC
ncbi:hypothetical protein DH2020_032819 [Rehmannia glutinosa]|uniref:UBC core domain-containing protein n=1 Tax=Rehmannia glutinosa TaxID=99300 RepID=A0ABR0VH26_REHGL